MEVKLGRNEEDMSKVDLRELLPAMASMALEGKSKKEEQALLDNLGKLKMEEDETMALVGKSKMEEEEAMTLEKKKKLRKGIRKSLGAEGTLKKKKSKKVEKRRVEGTVKAVGTLKKEEPRKQREYIGVVKLWTRHFYTEVIIPSKFGFERRWVGSYKTAEIAAAAYDVAAYHLYGSEAVLNFPHLIGKHDVQLQVKYPTVRTNAIPTREQQLEDLLYRF